MSDKEPTRKDRFRGCLLGLAVGDAVGTALEFSKPGAFTPIDDMVGGGPFRLKPGEWTDDTSMALCLAESLIEKNGYDPGDQMERYLSWYKTGHLSHNGRCFDIGMTVRSALYQFDVSREPYCGATDIRTAGNGCLMRLAPVPMFFAKDPEAAITKSGDSSRTTHGTLFCIDACRYYAGLIVGALAGASKADLLSELYSPIPGYWEKNPLAPDIEEIARGSFKHREPPEIQGSGYVRDSLEAGLWAFYKSDSFREGCLLAANLGRDADTTAAVYGQLAGAFYGESGIPAPWVEKLAMLDTIRSFADKIYEASL